MRGKVVEELYRPLDGVRIRKVLRVDRERAVRFYSEQMGLMWALQLRAPMTVGNGEDGRDFVVAHASLVEEDLIELRDAIDTALKAAQELRGSSMETLAVGAFDSALNAVKASREGK